MSKEATEAARRKAAEEGVEVESVEGSGSGGKVTATDIEKAVEEGEAKFLAYANPALDTYSVTVYPNDNPADSLTFYRLPSSHPEGPEAQMVTQEQFDKLNFDRDGIMALVRKGN